MEKMGKMEKMGEKEKMGKRGEIEKMEKMVKCQMQPERRRREGCCSLELRLSTIPCRKISLN